MTGNKEQQLNEIEEKPKTIKYDAFKIWSKDIIDLKQYLNSIDKSHEVISILNPVGAYKDKENEWEFVIITKYYV